MGYGLLGAHVNYTVGGIPEIIAQWKPPLVVLLDHSSVWVEVKKATPNSLFVGRFYQESEPDFNHPDLDPIQAARRHCARVLPWAERMGKAYDYWQGVNEPVVNSPDAMKRYARFDAERARIMAEYGFRVVVGTFSVGNPKLSYWNDFLPALEAARQYHGALALHEYAWPTLDTEWKWYLLRHRKVYRGDKTRDWAGFPKHLSDLPLLITECGLDGLIEQGNSPRGWRTMYGDKPDRYLKQLSWYDAALKRDRYVGGAAVYCCGVGHSDWSSYDIWPDVAQAIAKDATPEYRVEPNPILRPIQPIAPVKPPSRPSLPIEPERPPVHGDLEWRMKVDHRAGARIIAGSFPTAGIEIAVTDQWGNRATTIAGTKPEYGRGGFEVLAPHAGVYTLTFDSEAFRVQTRDGATIVTFSQIAVAPKIPEPAPKEPPKPVEPSPPEVPAVPEPPKGKEEPTDEDVLLDEMLERLDRIMTALQARI